MEVAVGWHGHGTDRRSLWSQAHVLYDVIRSASQNDTQDYSALFIWKKDPYIVTEYLKKVEGRSTAINEQTISVQQSNENESESRGQINPDHVYYTKATLVAHTECSSNEIKWNSEQIHAQLAKMNQNTTRILGTFKWI